MTRKLDPQNQTKETVIKRAPLPVTHVSEAAPSRADIEQLRQDLLSHYDAHGRTLPWRIRPEDRARGVQADPYSVWLSEIMLQQTTVAHATPYWKRFLSEFPTVIDLANAERDRVLTLWAGLGYYARARNLHKCAETVRDLHDGVFPTTEAALLKLPGIGLYTAAAIAAICFNEPTNIVDGNVERVIARFFAVDAPLPKARKILRDLAGSLADPVRPGDYGQAIMDLGAKTCTPRKPLCVECPWQWKCKAYSLSTIQACAVTDYPKKLKKTSRPIRSGAVFVLTCGDGDATSVWLAQRPDDGLLGGMMGFVGTQWRDMKADDPSQDLQYAPYPKNWELLDGEIRHVFTHFDLRLRVYRAQISDSDRGHNINSGHEGSGAGDFASRDFDIAALEAGKFIRLSDIENYALPTVMKKALQHALQRAEL